MNDSLISTEIIVHWTKRCKNFDVESRGIKTVSMKVGFCWKPRVPESSTRRADDDEEEDEEKETQPLALGAPAV